MKSYTTYKVTEEHAGLTVEKYLKDILQYSGRKIQKLTHRKGIRLNGKTAFLQKKVKAADTLSVVLLEDTTYGVQPEKGIIEMLYEDEHLIILNKPPQQLVHPTGRTTGGTLANYLAYYLKERGQLNTIRPVHRLDRETTGCVIFAKDSRSQFILEQQLKEGSLKRTYWALVKGVISPPSGTIDAPIGPHPTLPNRRAVTPQGEQAITHYRILRTSEDASLLELSLETGRTHQIRLHLAHRGCPILGDHMYGVRSPLINRQALHATSVSFINPQDNRPLTVNAPLPKDFAQALDNYSK
ncbi:RluA family pseudouridine synthase [Desulfotomaculum sp. 1211_IL3151]|uniref:RluA family pseudouridine synthase n=1 Tax=Desulfotomaculum sp. 1211_IL3151 TaxID=3084055 RepID=UPI002FD9FEC3